MMASPIFSGTPTQSMDGAPINSTSPRRSSSACTSGVTSSGFPVCRTCSVSPLPRRFDGKWVSTSSTKYGKLRSSVAGSYNAM